jgi:hypothetical protein
MHHTSQSLVRARSIAGYDSSRAFRFVCRRFPGQDNWDPQRGLPFDFSSLAAALSEQCQRKRELATTGGRFVMSPGSSGMEERREPWLGFSEQNCKKTRERYILMFETDPEIQIIAEY